MYACNFTVYNEKIRKLKMLLLLEFAQKTKQIESSGGINRINPDSSARGDFQWLTKVNPKAKKGDMVQ